MRATAASVLSRQPMALVVSSGFAGALMPAEIGDLFIGTSVSAGVYDRNWKQGTDSFSCDAAIVKRIQSVAKELNVCTRIGPVVSVSVVVCRAEDKRALGLVSGAAALDMESAALALVAREKAVPFVVLRTISDLAGEDLPLDFNLFLRPTGWMRGMKELIAHPKSLVGLNRLRLQSRLAATRLTTVCQALAERGFGLLQSSDLVC